VALQASKFLLLAGVQFWNCSWQVSLQDFFWASWMPAIGREYSKAWDCAGDLTSACAAKRPAVAMPTTLQARTRACFNTIEPRSIPVRAEQEPGEAIARLWAEPSFSHASGRLQELQQQ
jgi:hypothetical protein